MFSSSVDVRAELSYKYPTWDTNKYTPKQPNILLLLYVGIWKYDDSSRLANMTIIADTSLSMHIISTTIITHHQKHS